EGVDGAQDPDHGRGPRLPPARRSTTSECSCRTADEGLTPSPEQDKPGAARDDPRRRPDRRPAPPASQTVLLAGGGLRAPCPRLDWGGGAVFPAPLVHPFRTAPDRPRHHFPPHHP